MVLALDFGSSFLKAQRFDESGSPTGPSARQPAHIGPDGTADVDEVAASAEALLDAVLSGGP